MSALEIKGGEKRTQARDLQVGNLSEMRIGPLSGLSKWGWGGEKRCEC